MIAFIGLLLLNFCSVASETLQPCDVSLFARSYIAVMQFNAIAMVDGNQSSLAALNAKLDDLLELQRTNRPPANVGVRMFYTMDYEHLLVTIVGGERGVDVGLISVKEMAKRKSVQIEEIAFGKPENRICGGRSGAFRPSNNHIYFNDGTDVQINIAKRTIENVNFLPKCSIKHSPSEKIFGMMDETNRSREGVDHIDQLEVGKFYIKSTAGLRYRNVLVSEHANLSSCDLRQYPTRSGIYGRMLIVPKNGGSKVDFGFEEEIFESTTTEVTLDSTSIPDLDLVSHETFIESTSPSSRERVDSTTMSSLSGRKRVEIQGEKVKIVIEVKRVKSELEKPRSAFGVYMTIAVFTVILVCTVASISIVMNFL